MKIEIKLNKNSSFNNKQHFFNCLKDLLEEWNDINLGLGPKEMDKQEAGFNLDRYKELHNFLQLTIKGHKI